MTGTDDIGTDGVGMDGVGMDGVGMDDIAGPDVLRQLVREVLREVLPALADQPSPAPGESAPGLAYPDLDEFRDPAYLDHDGRAASPGLAWPGRAASPAPVYPRHAEGGPATGPPSRPPTSVPRSDSVQKPPDSAAWSIPSPASGGGSRRNARNPVRVTVTGTQPGGSHIHEVGASQGRPGPGGAGQRPDDLDGSVQEVRLSTDEELHAFVLRVLRLADNPKRRRDIMAGRLRFTLAGAGGGQQVPAVTQRVDKGAVTERAVIAAAKAGAGLVLGPRAVLTPLARDKARALGVPVEKER